MISELLPMGWFLLSFLGCSGSVSEIPPAETDFRLTEGVEARDLVACVDDADALHVVFTNGATGDLHSLHSADGGGTWPLEAGVIGTGTGSSLVCDGDRVHLVWEDGTASSLGNGSIHFASTEDGGASWSDPFVVDGDPDGEFMSRAPVVSAVRGAVVVAWTDGRGGAFDIYAQSSTDGGARWLDRPVRVDTDAPGYAYSGAPVISGGEEGHVYVAWQDVRSGVAAIRASGSVDYGRSYDVSDMQLDAGGGDAHSPVAVQVGDVSWVVWHQEEASGLRGVWSARSLDGGQSWEAAMRMSPEDVDAWGAAAHASLERIQVVWVDDRSGAYDVYQRTSYDGGETFAGELRLDTDDAGASHSLAVGVAGRADGWLAVSWEDRRDDVDDVGFDDIYYVTSSNGGVTFDEEDLRVTGNAPGASWREESWVGWVGEELVFLWVDGRYGGGDVFFNRLVPGEDSNWVAPPPS